MWWSTNRTGTSFRYRKDSAVCDLVCLDTGFTRKEWCYVLKPLSQAQGWTLFSVDKIALISGVCWWKHSLPIAWGLTGGGDHASHSRPSTWFDLWEYSRASRARLEWPILVPCLVLFAVAFVAKCCKVWVDLWWSEDSADSCTICMTIRLGLKALGIRLNSGCKTALLWTSSIQSSLCGLCGRTTARNFRSASVAQSLGHACKLYDFRVTALCFQC